MKKIHKTISLIFIAATSLFISESKAQVTTCPYPIINNRNCDIGVTVETSDCGLPNTCIPYGGGTLVVIPAGQTLWVTSPCCFAPGDIFVWVREIGYTDVWSANPNQRVSCFSCSCLNSDGITGTLALPTTVPSPCDLPNFYTISWTPTSCTIN